jgi:hypothetical protein
MGITNIRNGINASYQDNRLKRHLRSGAGVVAIGARLWIADDLTGSGVGLRARLAGNRRSMPDGMPRPSLE